MPFYLCVQEHRTSVVVGLNVSVLRLCVCLSARSRRTPTSALNATCALSKRQKGASSFVSIIYELQTRHCIVCIVCIHIAKRKKKLINLNSLQKICQSKMVDVLLMLMLLLSEHNRRKKQGEKKTKQFIHRYENIHYHDHDMTECM